MAQPYSVIFLDMDGVLTNFTQAAAALFDQDASVLTQAGQSLHEALGITSRQLWAKIDDAGSAFWAELPPTDFADELVALVRGSGAKLMIATSPSQAASSSYGKVLWLQRRFGKRFRDFFIGSNKGLLGQAGRLLVDDTDKHCAAFRDAGGDAVLIPTMVNGTLVAGADPLAELRAALA